MKHSIVELVILVVTIAAGPAFGVVLTEDFEDPFPAWESDWLGANSNLQNYYEIIHGDPAYRGNNPDGLWLSDRDGQVSGDLSVDIVFTPALGTTLSSLSLDVAGWAAADLRVFDISGNTLLDVAIALTQGAYTDPGVYAHYSVTSANGILGFSFVPTSSSSIEGNTSIDNVVVNQGNVIPEPSTFLTWGGLFGVGLVGAWWRRRKA